MAFPGTPLEHLVTNMRREFYNNCDDHWTRIEEALRKAYDLGMTIALEYEDVEDVDLPVEELLQDETTP